MNTTDYHARFVERLESHGLNGEELCQMLNKTGSYVAGSFALQVLIDAEWEGSDLDIFTTTTEMSDYFEKDLERHEVGRELDEYIEEYTGVEVYIPSIVNLSEYILSDNFKIQVIILDTSSIYTDLEDVVNDFDIDVCKVAYDGNDLFVVNSKSIESKKYTIDFVKVAITKKKYDRIMKYERRGFVATNKDEFMRKYADHLDDLIDRHADIEEDLTDLLNKVKNEEFQEVLSNMAEEYQLYSTKCKSLRKNIRKR